MKKWSSNSYFFSQIMKSERNRGKSSGEVIEVENQGFSTLVNPNWAKFAKPLAPKFYLYRVSHQTNRNWCSHDISGGCRVTIWGGALIGGKYWTFGHHSNFRMKGNNLYFQLCETEWIGLRQYFWYLAISRLSGLQLPEFPSQYGYPWIDGL